MKDLVAILMAGGAGTRFWPVSTEQRPKQFLNLFGGRTLLHRISCRWSASSCPRSHPSR